MVPILIANPDPFRLIVRDENDLWEPTLDDINKSTYNYVKLHRASLFFDADLKCGLPACVAFDGSFILPANSDYSTIESSLDEFNRIFASIFLGGLYITSITPSDLSQGTMSIHGYYRHTRTFGSSGALYKSLGNRDAGNSYNINLLNPARIYRDDVTKAYKSGSQTFRNIDNLSPSLFISAFTYYLEFQTREALTNAWICIEQILEYLWSKIMLPDVKSINISGRRKFMESQQWTAAHKIEVLYQSKVLTAETYSKLTNARNSRNKFIHMGAAPTRESARDALYALTELIDAASTKESFNFDKQLLHNYIAEKGDSRHINGVTKAENVDWSNVSHWKQVMPIPGDKHWVGEFETFEDITLQTL
jgi:hypothetical protein